MQTFLPLPDFRKSLECLDNARLGKQRVESMQLIDAIYNPRNSWRRHPACQMWFDYPDALGEYLNISIDIWKKRGFVNNMCYYDVSDSFDLPPWFGWEPLHSSHRSNLLRKDYYHYSKFNWKESDNDPYVWPGRFFNFNNAVAS